MEIFPVVRAVPKNTAIGPAMNTCGISLKKEDPIHPLTAMATIPSTHRTLNAAK